MRIIFQPEEGDDPSECSPIVDALVKAEKEHVEGFPDDSAMQEILETAKPAVERIRALMEKKLLEVIG
jgi:hypothetical protein